MEDLQSLKLALVLGIRIGVAPYDALAFAEFMATSSGETLSALSPFSIKSAPDLGRVWTAALGGFQLAAQIRRADLHDLPRTVEDRALQPLVLLRWGDVRTIADGDQRRLWQQLWHAVNLLLPSSNTWVVADESCSLSDLTSSPVYQSKLQGSPEWIEACELAHGSLSGLMGRLSLRGFEAPTVGYELTDAVGCVVAEAELAWPASRTAVVMVSELAAAFSNAGWTVVLASDEHVETTLEAALVDRN
jgi:DEAD/DEAH box helicase domain-containing protein